MIFYSLESADQQSKNMTLFNRVLWNALVQNSRKGFKGNYSSSPSSSSRIDEKIHEMIKKSKVVVFMKGVPEAPQCGFSNAVCQILTMHQVPFEGYNVLQNDDIRQGIKDYSNWPTIPQVYFKGEFIGGADILLQMHQNGDIIKELNKIGIKSALAEEGAPFSD